MPTVKVGVTNVRGIPAGLTVAELRAEVGKRWALSPSAPLYLGDLKLSEDYVVQEADSVEFRHG